MTAFVGWLFGRDLRFSLKWIRNAWVVGFLWAGWSFIGAVTGIWGLSAEGEGELSLSLFILAILEVGIIAYLSYGIMRRNRWLGTLLFFYFWLSRIFWIIVGMVGLFSAGDIAKFLVLQFLPAFVFFQGMRGLWSYYYLTHPNYGLVNSGSAGPP